MACVPIAELGAPGKKAFDAPSYVKGFMSPPFFALVARHLGGRTMGLWCLPRTGGGSLTTEPVCEEHLRTPQLRLTPMNLTGFSFLIADAVSVDRWG